MNKQAVTLFLCVWLGLMDMKSVELCSQERGSHLADCGPYTFASPRLEEAFGSGKRKDGMKYLLFTVMHEVANFSNMLL